MIQDGMRTERKIAYALPMVPAFMLHTPALSMLPALYAKHASIDLVVIGIILVATRALDAITDPLIGILSDRTKTKIGSRKPWMIAGMLLCCLGAWFWFRPGPETGWVYFLLWSVVVYVGWTLFEIPHAAWLSELTHDYAERARLASFRSAASFCGWALFLSLPFLPIFPTTEMTPEVTAMASWVVLVIFPAFLLVAIFRVPAGVPELCEQPALRETLSAALCNRPFWIYAAAVLTSGVAAGMVGGLYFFYLDAYLGILDKIAHIGLVSAVISILAARLWSPVIVRIGKHRVMFLGSAINVLVLAGMGLTPPGEWAFPVVLGLFSMSSVVYAGSMVAQYSIVADISDFDTLKSRKNHAGSYYALSAFLVKLGIALGGGLGFVIVGLFGFEPAAENDTLAMTGFFLSFIIIPMGLYAIAAGFAWAFPLNRHRHNIIRKRLDERAAREQAP